MLERLIRRTTVDQVAEAVEVAILSGEFERGGRLPPERKLAAILGVSRLTLREGLNRLVARGRLIAVPGLGTYVANAQMAQSLDTLPGLYVVTKAATRRVALVHHYLELRRFAFATVLSLACARADRESDFLIKRALDKIADSAEATLDVDLALELEIEALQVAAERAKAFGFWLLINHVREFFRVARADLRWGLTPERMVARARALVEAYTARDAARVARVFQVEFTEDDQSTLRALRTRQENAVPAAGADPATAAAASGPAQAPTPAASGAPGAAIPIPPDLQGWSPKVPDVQEPPSADAQAARKECHVGDHSIGLEAARAVAPPEVAALAPARCSTSTGEPLKGAEEPLSATQPAPVPPAVSSTGDPHEYVPKPGGARDDPASWYPGYIAFFRRTFGCYPWEDGATVPPGINYPLPETTPPKSPEEPDDPGEDPKPG